MTMNISTAAPGMYQMFHDGAIVPLVLIARDKGEA